MYDRKELVHQMRNGLEVRGNVVRNIYRTLSESPPKLRNVRYSDIIKSPQRIFIKGFNSFFQPDLDAISQQIILAKKVLFLDTIVQVRII